MLREREALGCATVLALIWGLSEGIATLARNAYVQVARYALVYLTLPVFVWLLTAVVVVTATVAVLRVLRLDARHGTDAVGVIMAAAGGVSWALAVEGNVHNRFEQIGVEPSAIVSLVLGLAVVVPVLVLVTLVLLVLRNASLRRLCGRLWLLLPVLVALTSIPVMRFFATEWRWGAANVSGLQQTNRPNVLLVSIDTLRADQLGLYGGSESVTPVFDRLGHQGVLFEWAVSTSPWTLPAVASLHTGLYPRRHGAGRITNGRDPLGRSALPLGEWTLAGALRRAGYSTHAIVTNPYLGVQYGLDQGFDSYENVTIESEAFLAFRHLAAYRVMEWLRPALATPDRGEIVSREAVSWLRSWVESGGARRSFFLWLHYVDPHAPYGTQAAPNKSFRGDSLIGGAGESRGANGPAPDIARLRSGEVRLDEREKRLMRVLYRGEVEYTDRVVGRVMDALDTFHLSANTLVVVVADHGEEFWDHGGVEHGHTLYDELLHVPLIMRWAGGLPRSRRIGAQVRLTDVAPTILDLLDLPSPRGIDGRSLLPLVQGKDDVPRPALAENLLFAEERVALRLPGWKYVRWASGKTEVYDLRADPEERLDLSGLPERRRPLQRQLTQMLDTLDQAATARSMRRPAVDARTRSALRALGYLR